MIFSSANYDACIIEGTAAVASTRRHLNFALRHATIDKLKPFFKLHFFKEKDNPQVLASIIIFLIFSCRLVTSSTHATLLLYLRISWPSRTPLNHPCSRVLGATGSWGRWMGRRRAPPCGHTPSHSPPPLWRQIAFHPFKAFQPQKNSSWLLSTLWLTRAPS